MKAAQLFLRQFVGAGIAAVIHQRDEGRLAVGLLVGKRKIIAEGTVDEFRAGVGIEQHDADVDLVERRRKTLGGGVMPALPRERIHHSFPQQAGDAGGAGRGHRQHRQANQVGRVVAGRCTVVEEKQRRRSHRNGGADHAGGEAAEGARERDDADEQRRGIGNGNEMTIDKDGDQRCRRRQSRTGYCAPVELHARFSVPPRETEAHSLTDRCNCGGFSRASLRMRLTRSTAAFRFLGSNDIEGGWNRVPCSTGSCQV